MSEALWTGLIEILYVDTYLFYLNVALYSDMGSSVDFGCDADLDSCLDSNLVTDLSSSA